MLINKCYHPPRCNQNSIYNPVSPNPNFSPCVFQYYSNPFETPHSIPYGQHTDKVIRCINYSFPSKGQYTSSNRYIPTPFQSILRTGVSEYPSSIPYTQHKVPPVFETRIFVGGNISVDRKTQKDRQGKFLGVPPFGAVICTTSPAVNTNDYILKVTPNLPYSQHDLARLSLPLNDQYFNVKGQKYSLK